MSKRGPFLRPLRAFFAPFAGRAGFAADASAPPADAAAPGDAAPALEARSAAVLRPRGVLPDAAVPVAAEDSAVAAFCAADSAGDAADLVPAVFFAALPGVAFFGAAFFGAAFFAGALFEVAFFAVAFFAGDFLAGAFFAVAFLPVDFLAGDLPAGVRFAPPARVDLPEPFFAAVLRPVRFGALLRVFFAADRDVDFRPPVLFFAAFAVAFFNVFLGELFFAGVFLVVAFLADFFVAAFFAVLFVAAFFDVLFRVALFDVAFVADFLAAVLRPVAFAVDLVPRDFAA